jgi:flagella basal body P-ring formation protein FlgA
VICARDVDTAPLISKHDNVVLHCSQGDVQVSVVAEAMEEGNVGSRIKVRRDASHPLVLATVTGKGEVNACI